MVMGRPSEPEDAFAPGFGTSRPGFHPFEAGFRARRAAKNSCGIKHLDQMELRIGAENGRTMHLGARAAGR